jgi:hypothetical protein
MKTRSGNKQGPSGDIMPRRSKRASPPSTPDPQTEATATRSTKGRKVEPAKKKKRTKLERPMANHKLLSLNFVPDPAATQVSKAKKILKPLKWRKPRKPGCQAPRLDQMAT